MPPGGAPSGSRAWIPGPSPARSGGHCTAMWSSGSIRSPAPSGTRSPCMMTPSQRDRSAGRGAGGTGGGHRRPARRLRHPLHPGHFLSGTVAAVVHRPGGGGGPQAAFAGRDHSQSGRGDGAGGAAGLEAGYGGPDGALHFSPGRGGHGTAHSHWGGVIARNRASAGLGLVVCHAAMISSTSPSPMRGTNTRLSAL